MEKFPDSGISLHSFHKLLVTSWN